MGIVGRYLVAGGLLVAVWKAAALGLASNMLPAPEAALTAFGQAVKTRTFWIHFSASAYRVASAMALAWLIAFPAGILLGFHRQVDRYLSPFVFRTYPIPKIVLLPVFLVLSLADCCREKLRLLSLLYSLACPPVQLPMYSSLIH